MKRFTYFLAAMLASTVVYAQPQLSPEQRAAREKQEALEKSTPQLQITEEVLKLVIPGHTIGEATGVAKNSQGHLFVFTRSGSGGDAIASTASELFEFDQNLNFVKQWGPDNYAASFAHTVRVDKDDNVYMTDEGSNMVVKFNPDGTVAMVLGRKPEAIDWLQSHVERGEKDEERYTEGNMNTFNRPTDVAVDAADGDIFVSDGYNNSRVAKIDKNGNWIKSVGSHGSGPLQFSTPHGIAIDAKGIVYVADRGNRRVQVFDNDLNHLRNIETVAAPWTVCVSPGEPQYLFSGDGTGKIYKTDLEGNLLGWAQTSLNHGQSGCLIHTLHCESDTVLYKGDCSTWTVEKITINGGGVSDGAR
jgi:DNA-binding beta-propeller fold protein YncE